MCRDTDETIGSDQPARDGYRQTVRAQMHSVQVHGQYQIDTIVHDQRNGARRRNRLDLARQHAHFARGKVAFPKLDGWQSCVDGLPDKKWKGSATRLSPVGDKE
jgi:hypothetical protein